MTQIWKMAIVGVACFLIGSIGVVSAQAITQMSITDANGVNTAEVTSGGRLKVNVRGSVKVSNFPDVQTVELIVPSGGDLAGVVNLRSGPSGICPDAVLGQGCVDIDGDGIGDVPFSCGESWGGFIYEVPAGQNLKVTDIIFDGNAGAALVSDARGVLLRVPGDITGLITPLIVFSGETLCALKSRPEDGVYVFGHLVNAP